MKGRRMTRSGTLVAPLRGNSPCGEVGEQSPSTEGKGGLKPVIWSKLEQLGAWSAAGRVRSMVSALVLLGAVCFTLVAAYQWAGRLGFLNAGRDGQTRVWSTVLAIIL